MSWHKYFWIYELNLIFECWPWAPRSRLQEHHRQYYLVAFPLRKLHVKYKCFGVHNRGVMSNFLFWNVDLEVKGNGCLGTIDYAVCNIWVCVSPHCHNYTFCVSPNCQYNRLGLCYSHWYTAFPNSRDTHCSLYHLIVC